MFSATMSSISGLLNLHASIISKDIFPTLFPRRAGEAEKLGVAWAATFGVGVAITGIALTMAARGRSVFQMMVTFNTVMSLAYGPPALLGLLVRRTPSGSGLAAFAVALVVGVFGTFAKPSCTDAPATVILPARGSWETTHRFFATPADEAEQSRSAPASSTLASVS